jgi:hypothetical protein
MPNNYILLERIELNASAASVTFANIPQTGYTDLKIVASCRSDVGGPQIVNISFNGITTGYSAKVLEGNGSSASSSNASAWIFSTMDNANIFGNAEFYIPNYTSSNAKSYSSDSVTEANATTAYMPLIAGLWSYSGNPAITSITLTQNAGNFRANSTFSLYGLAALGTTPAIAPKANGGNVIATDGTYWYHAFTSSGSFVPQVGLTADVLQIAGGGGGGSWVSGGGGAGGLLAYTSQSLSTTNYAVTVGAGGAGAAANSNTSFDAAGFVGGNSSFGSLTASAGGGGGGCFSDNASFRLGRNGGSGGGAGYLGTSGGTATSGQGNNGGNAASASQYYAAGGGGAGAVGANADTSTGGNGVSTYSSWGLATTTGQNISGTVWYAGGGGGARQSGDAAGGNGGGGTGKALSGGAGVAATTNTGGGGGGCRDASAGGNGGSGIIIVRYPIV